MFDPIAMIGGGGRGELEFEMRGNLPIDQLDQLSDEILRRLRAQPGFVDLSKSLRVGLPELRVIPDREKCAALGIDARSLAQVVQAGIGGLDVAKFKEGGHRYNVRVRLDDAFRADPESIGAMYIRTGDGGAVELRNVARIETGAAPSTISRDQRQRSVTISANLEALPVGDAIDVVRRATKDVLPEGATIHFGGSAEQFLQSLRQFALAIGLAVLIIYMVLAAQFESLLHPLTVMLALPLAMVGAFGGLLVMHLFRLGMTINLFSVIGIILLMGLVTKNSILLVDFANELRARGLDPVAAMREAAPVRMRPVLMTGGLDDPRRAARRDRDRPGRRDARADGRRDRRGHAVVGGADACSSCRCSTSRSTRRSSACALRCGEACRAPRRTARTRASVGRHEFPAAAARAARAAAARLPLRAR